MVRFQASAVGCSFHAIFILNKILFTGCGSPFLAVISTAQKLTLPRANIYASSHQGNRFVFLPPNGASSVLPSNLL